MMAISVIPDPYITGTVVAVVTVIGVLNKKGIINLPISKNSSNNRHKVCPAHESIVTGQTEHSTILGQVKEELKKGSEKFDKVDEKIDTLNVNVGILLDRSK